MTAAERQYVKNFDPLKVGYVSDDAPFSYSLPSGQPAGIYPEALRELAHKLGISIEFVDLTRSDSSAALRSGVVHAIVAIDQETKLRSALPAGKIFDIPLVIYTMRASPEVKAAKDLKIIGTVRGDPSEKYLRHNVSSVMLERSDSYEEMFVKLIKGEIPAMSGERQVIEHIARKRGVAGHIQVFGLPLFVLSSSVYVHVRNEKLPGLFERAIRCMVEDGTLERIEQIHTGVSITDYTCEAEKSLYSAVALLLLSFVILAVALFVGGRPQRSEEVEIRSGNPFEDYGGDVPLNRYSVRHLLTGLTRTLRMTTAVFRTPSGEDLSVPENIRFTEGEDLETLLDVDSDVIEQHSKYHEWYGAKLPRGSRIAFRSRLRTLTPELKMLCYVYGALLEAAAEGSQYAAGERALREIVKTGFELKDQLLCVLNKRLEVEEAYGCIVPVSADMVLNKDLADFLDQRGLKGVRKNIEQVARSSRFDAKGDILLLSENNRIPCSYRMSYRVLSRGDRIIIAIRDERTPTRIEEAARKAYRFDSLGSLAVAFISAFETMFLAIQGYAGILLRENDPQSGERHVSRISDYAERGRRLSEKLLIIALGSWPSPQSMELTGFMNETMRTLVTAFPDHEIVTRAVKGEHHIDTDPDLLLLCIFALLSNAIEASPPQSEVIVESKITELPEDYKVHSGVLNHGAYAIIQVTDKGEGMNSSEAAMAIEPFQTTKDESHRGLGLTVTVHAVNAFGGGLEIDTAKGKGTTAKLYVPTRERSSLRDQDLTGSGENLLLVNPSQEWLDILSSIFTRFNYQTSNVLLTTDAKRILQSQEFDAIVYEPERAGADTVLFIEDVRRLHPMLPIIVILAAGETRAFNKLIQDDKTYVVVRTGDVKHIVHQIRKIIRS
ncbi:MAG: transporter substrate-binding domain-containing protein [Planctomycetota bacterium]|nr:transporter substrate-binding domain-containing protein [Planctomycetota bacterium]